MTTYVCKNCWSDSVSIEKRPDGDVICNNCGYRWKNDGKIMKHQLLCDGGTTITKMEFLLQNQIEIRPLENFDLEKIIEKIRTIFSIVDEIRLHRSEYADYLLKIIPYADTNSCGVRYSNNFETRNKTTKITDTYYKSQFLKDIYEYLKKKKNFIEMMNETEVDLIDF